MKYLYEKYHAKRKLQRRIINENNFTYRNILPILNRYVRNRDNVLDIGCGTGTLDFYLANKYKDIKIIGTDISANAINIAKTNSNNFKLSTQIKYIKQNFLDLNIKAKFNIIICSEIIEHLENDKKAVEKIYKLLSNNGIVIISTPSINAPLFKMGLLNRFDKEVGHLRRYNLKILNNLLKGVGMKVIHTSKAEGIIRNFLFTNDIAGKTLRLIRGPLVPCISFLDDVSLKIFGESQLFIIAIKK